MNSGSEVGRIAALWRFPFKSMRGEQIGEAHVARGGLTGDRAFALEDLKTGRIVSAKEIRRFPGLLGFRATFSAEPAQNGPLPPVIIEMPDGRTITSDDPDASRVLSGHFGREVRIVEGGAHGGGAEAGSPAYHDAAPVSVISRSTLGRMNSLQPGSIFDTRRFRMNLVLECVEAGFPENEWVGSTVKVGADIRLLVTRLDARCVMTTLAQDDLPEDRGILTGLAQHNRLPVGDKGSYPCAGVYASVESAGTAKVGDRVVLV